MVTTAEEPDELSVMDRMTPLDYSSDDGVALEVAIETINEVVGAYNARLYAEQAKPEPDASVVAKLRKARTDCIHDQDSFRLTDMAHIEATRLHYAALLHSLRS